MTQNSVVIKGNKYGIMLMLDCNVPFEEIKLNLASKFKESAKFFGSGFMALTIEGRAVNKDQEKEIIDIISQNSELNIVCIMDMDENNQERYRSLIEETLVKNTFNEPKKTNTIQETEKGCSCSKFVQGTLRSGQVFQCEESVVILGDVNPGAKIVSAGSVVVLGSLKGSVYAGVNGDLRAIVIALEMNPVQIRIGDIIACSGDKPKKSTKHETKIAYVDDGNIYIDLYSKEIVNELNNI